MDVNRMGPVELRVFALFAAAAAADQPVTVREVSGLAGPNGRTIGSRSAMTVTRDLMDAGLVALSPSLAEVGLDGPIAVAIAGRNAPSAAPSSPSSPAPVPQRATMPEMRESSPFRVPDALAATTPVSAPAARGATAPTRAPATSKQAAARATASKAPASASAAGKEPAPTAAEAKAARAREPKKPRDRAGQGGLRRVGTLNVPPGMPQPLLDELTAIVEGFRAHQAAGAPDLSVVAALTKRKAAALDAWAAEPEPLGSPLVRAEAERAHRAYETTLQQLAQQRGIVWDGTDPEGGGGEHAPVGGLGPSVRGALGHIAGTEPGVSPVSRLLALVCLLRGVGSGTANLTGPDLRIVCNMEAESAVGELVSSGWMTVDAEELLATEEDPVACGVPGVEGFTLGKVPRTRSSGWIARVIGNKKVRRQPARVRLAAACIAAHCAADGTARTELAFLGRLIATPAEELPDVAEALVECGWLSTAKIVEGEVHTTIAEEHMIFVEALRTNTPVQTLQAAARAAAAEQEKAAQEKAAQADSSSA